MSEALDTPTGFHIKLTVGWVGLAFCAYFTVFILKRIELNATIKRKKKKPRFDENVGNDTVFKVTTADDDNASVVSSTTATTTTIDSPGHSSEFEAHIHDIATDPKYFEPQEDEVFADNDGASSPRIVRTKLRLEEKLQLYAMVTILLFLTYLLLVYLPSGVLASLLGTIGISVVVLKSQIADEIRRNRYDRLAAVATLIIFAASFLSLITYASIGLREGTIYEGPARIIGYDTSIYETRDGEATRMDLEVSWGGDWGWYVLSR